MVIKIYCANSFKADLQEKFKVNQAWRNYYIRALFSTSIYKTHRRFYR